MASSNDNAIPSSPSRTLNRITSTYIHSDSIIDTNPIRPATNNENQQSSTWIQYLSQVDRLLSGGLSRLCYDVTNIVLLSLGLYYGTETCPTSSSLVKISITLIVANALTLLSTFFFAQRNWHFRHMPLSDETSSQAFRPGYAVRGFFRFIRLICICVGTGYAFTSTAPVNNDCEIVRFYLGVVCFNAWLLMLTSMPKPSLPIRRTLTLHCIIFLYILFVNSLHFGLVLSALMKTNESDCIYSRIDDLYFRAPLVSFGCIGLILILCITINALLVTIMNQLFYQLSNWRRFFLGLSAVSYVINYLITFFLIYYYSVGAVLVFHPRLGGSCRTVASNLYNTLLIWQIIRSFLSLIILLVLPLILCFGVVLGSCLIRCLPASIVVPLVEMLHVFFYFYDIRNSMICLFCLAKNSH